MGGDGFLRMSEKDLWLTPPDPAELALYPDSIVVGDKRFRSVYRFAPGAEEDGLTVRIPSPEFAVIPDTAFEWGPPGYFRDKVEALVKGLPKAYRKQLQPIANTVDIITRGMRPAGLSLFESLAAFVRGRFGLDIPAREWAAVEPPALPQDTHRPHGPRGKRDRGRARSGGHAARRRPLSHARGFFRVAGGATAMGADGHHGVGFRRAAGERPGRPLPHRLPGARAGGEGRQRPPVQGQGRGAGVARARRRGAPGGEVRQGHRLPAPLSSRPRRARESVALYFGGKPALEKKMQEKLRAELFRRNIRTRRDYEAHASTLNRAMAEAGHKLQETTMGVLEAYRQTRDALQSVKKPAASKRALVTLVEEARLELDRLVPADFLDLHPLETLKELPRYVSSLWVRVQRGKNDPEKDRKKAEEVQPFAQALAKLEKETVKAAPDFRRAVEELRGMLEEFRVAVFAPELKTAYPVSAKRLAAKIKEINDLRRA